LGRRLLKSLVILQILGGDNYRAKCVRSREEVRRNGQRKHKKAKNHVSCTGTTLGENGRGGLLARRWGRQRAAPTRGYVQTNSKGSEQIILARGGPINLGGNGNTQTGSSKREGATKKKLIISEPEGGERG